MELQQLIDLYVKYGPWPTTAALVFVALQKKWLVLGWTYTEMKQDRDQWRTKAESGQQERQNLQQGMQLYVEWVMNLIDRERGKHERNA